MGNTNRNRTTGRYTDTNFSKPCTCGHRLGEHDAERAGDYQPCQHADCPCESFHHAPRPRRADPKIPISLRLAPALLDELKTTAARDGIGYQTLIHKILNDALT